MQHFGALFHSPLMVTLSATSLSRFFWDLYTQLAATDLACERRRSYRSVLGRFEEQGKLHLPLAVVPGHFLLQFADTVAIFGHADDLIAARHKLPDSIVLGELLVPADAGRRFVLY